MVFIIPYTINEDPHIKKSDDFHEMAKAKIEILKKLEEKYIEYY